VFPVRSDAAAGQCAPETQGRYRVVALHPFGGAVAGRTVLEAEDQRGGFVVREQCVVAEVRVEGTGHER
jgi:hypothetical protein